MTQWKDEGLWNAMSFCHDPLCVLRSPQTTPQTHPVSKSLLAEPRKIPLLTHHTPVFHFSQCLSGMYCSGSDIRDNSTGSLAEVHTKCTVLAPSLILSTLKTSFLRCFLSLAQNKLQLHVLCDCVFNIFNLQPLPDLTIKTNCVSGMSCTGAQTRSLFCVHCVDMCWDINWHSWFHALNISNNAYRHRAGTPEPCQFSWYAMLFHKEKMHSSSLLVTSLFWTRSCWTGASLWYQKCCCQVVFYYLKEIYLSLKQNCSLLSLYYGNYNIL